MNRSPVTSAADPVLPAAAGPASGGVIDLTDVEMFAANRHHEAFRRLREESPVYLNPSADGTPFWALTRYEDVLAAYRDHDAFSSAHGAILGGSFRAGGGDTASGDMLVASDPPRHRMLRKVMHPPFNSAMVDRVTAQVRTLVRDAVDAMHRDGGCDIALDFAPLLPVGALMAMFGVGRDDARHIVGLTREMVGYRDATLSDLVGDERTRLAHAQSAIFEYFADLLEERRDAAGDDVIGMLLRSEINGEPLDDTQILYNCMNIAVGGNETSSYTTCSGILAFLENPGEWRRLAAGRELLSSAIEEILRWSSTNAYVQRVAVRDVVVRQTRIAAGDVVTLWNVSANRDPDQFDAPERFDITRAPNRHLSFGSGIHRCIGAPTGNAEIAEAFGALLDGGLGLRLAGEPVRLHSNFILGFTSLPVEVGD
ncbi:cytochrome P450 [Streptomyces apocyni]|uniref:cytochrome P450 n=1 Tax=Streptomyces apocyni TaxID=2654677 RepID=UPI0012EB0104|nr:cytochrome P450 [Streptomyces apocyni]